MTVVEEFTHILEKEKEKELIPFLQRIEKPQKKELYSSIKKLHKFYSEYVQTPGSTSYSSRWTDPKRYILNTAAFICFNQNDFEQSTAYGVINKKSLDLILPWYCPDWFNSYVDKLSLQDYIVNYFNYDWYLELIEQGYLKVNKQMVAKILPENIFVQGKDRKYKYQPENLLTREITLKEHVWYLFEFETNLHGSERYKQFSDNSVEGRWMKTLKMYVDDGKISREHILKEAISSATKNFNQSSSNWFIDLFVYLEPTKLEILSLQNELLNTFNSVNSKPYNVVLKFFKDLALEDNFELNSFLDHVPLILTGNSKTGISSAFMVLEKLAKKYPEHSEQICIISCNAFICQDNSLQLRAAKLIHKYGDVNSERIKENIQIYHASLFSDARDLLTGFSIDVGIDGNVLGGELIEEKPKLVKIQTPQTFDEFVFLVSQAFDQNETYHFDLLPASILHFQKEMTAENILKLMPAFQRAYKMITSDWTASMGYLDNMLMTFWTSYGQLLVNLYPIAAEPIQQMHDTFVKLEDDKKYKWSGYKKRLGSIKTWDIFTHSLGYKSHKHILLNAFFMLERNVSLPLLSTPTHEPCWISPQALIDRLSQYQEANVIPGDMDLQVAMARCFKENNEGMMQLANEKLTGEYRDLLGYVLGEEHEPKDGYTFKAAWLVAALTKRSDSLNHKWFSFSSLSDVYLTGEFQWDSLIENYIWKEYNYQQKKHVDIPSKRKVIRINFGERRKKVSAFKTVLSKIIPSQDEPENSICANTELKFQYITAEHNDIKRLLYLNPHRPEILLAHIINTCFTYVDFAEENNKKMIIYTLETLLTLNHKYDTIGHLFIASCMISSDKTVRTYASELWIKGVTEEVIDSGVVGEIIGKHEQIELAPLKRFTDLIMSNMYQISQKHNKMLEDLLTKCICKMNDKPINGTKKLLEIYAEVLSGNKNSVESKNALDRLNVWESVEALRKVIQKIKRS